MAISNAWLKATHGKPSSKRYEKTDRDGMSARVSQNGAITFQIRYRYAGKMARCTLGEYPKMGLKEARDEAQRLFAELDKGHDPRVVRKIERAAIQSVPFLQEVFGQWHEVYCVLNKKNHAEIKRSFEIHVFPFIGNWPIDRVAIHHWSEIIEALAKGKPAIAERVLINAQQMYRWAMRRQIVDKSPLAGLSAKSDFGLSKRNSSRVLSDEEIRYFWLAVEEGKTRAISKIFLKLCLLFGCRNGELRMAERGHFDFEGMVWVTPAQAHKTGSKTGKGITRALIPETADMIREAMALSRSDSFVFSLDGVAPLSMGFTTDAPYHLREYLRRHQGFEMAHWSIHDLRRTMRTRISPFAAPHIAELILGHKLPGEWQTYDHYQYIEEMRVVYRQWHDTLMQIVRCHD